jgi:hypothetical protein
LPNFADSLSEKARAKGLQRDDYRIKALIQNGKVMTKDHEGNIKTITLRENEALIFVEIRFKFIYFLIIHYFISLFMPLLAPENPELTG